MHIYVMCTINLKNINFYRKTEGGVIRTIPTLTIWKAVQLINAI